MDGLQVTVLRFELEATSMLHFGPQPGGQIRGALFNALRAHACPLRPHERVTQQHSEVCPVCALLSPRDHGAARGHTPPPPFALQPPPGDGRGYRTGDRLELGLVLFGDQSRLFPYVVHGLRTVGLQGVGYGRGTFLIQSIVAENPLTGERESLLTDEGEVHLPTLHVTQADVEVTARKLPPDCITLHFRTPTTLTARGRPARHPAFDILVARLLERLDLLADQYAPQASRTPHEHLNELAGDIQLEDNQTKWLELRSGSRRAGRTTPVSGFVGQATYQGPLAELLPWLVWGQLVQVGKNTAKGNGWYTLSDPALEVRNSPLISNQRRVA